MKMLLSRSQFLDYVRGMGRWDDLGRYDGWTRLFEYYVELEGVGGDEIEADAVGFCCEWGYYEDLKEIKEDYNNIEDIEDLKHDTKVLETESGGYLVRAF